MFPTVLCCEVLEEFLVGDDCYLSLHGKLQYASSTCVVRLQRYVITKLLYDRCGKRRPDAKLTEVRLYLGVLLVLLSLKFGTHCETETIFERDFNDLTTGGTVTCCNLNLAFGRSLALLELPRADQLQGKVDHTN